MTSSTEPARQTPVLLVDDHRVFTDSLEIALGLQPDLCCVAVAHTAREGLVRAAVTDFTVAVVDLQLPDSGGLDLIPQLLAVRPEARIVVLTAHPRPDLAGRAVAAGAVAFLGKDTALAHILDALRNARRDRPVLGVVPRPSGVELTHRELDVLRELGQGRDATRIAAALDISVYTARDHIKSVMAKLGVHSQLDAVVSAVRLGLITLDVR